MSEAESFPEYQSFRRKLRERVLLGSIVAILIGATILAIAPGNASTFGRLSIGDESLGTVGHSILDQSSSGQTEFVLLNTTEFTWQSGWITQIVSNNPDYIRFYQDSRGYHIEGASVRFLLYYYLNIIVDYYDTLELSTLVSSEVGNFTVGISSHFGLWWSDSFHTGNSADIPEGEERLHSLNISMDWVRSNTDKWIVQARFELEVTIESHASILIQRAAAKASSSEVLYPVTFDFQDKSGVSLYDAKETRRLLEIPMLNLTSNTMHKTAVLMQWSPDETIHVPIGGYFAEYGWLKVFGINFVIYTESRVMGNFYAEVTENAGKTLLVRMNVIRLNLEINPNLLFYLSIDGPSYLANRLTSYPLYWVSHYMPDVNNPSFYVPDDIEVLYVSIFIEAPGHPRIEASGEVTGANHMMLNAHFAYHSILGVAVDIVQLFLILLIVGLIAAMYISLRRSLYPLPLTSWIRRERFVPTLLLLLSFALPWASTRNVIASSEGPITVWSRFFLPLGVEATTPGAGDTIVTILGIERAQWIESWVDIWDAAGFFPIVFMLFWIPMLIVLYQYIQDKPVKLNLWVFLPVAIPAFAGIIVLFAFPTAQLLFGFVPALISFAAFLFLAMRRTDKWKSVVKHAWR